MAHDGGVVAAAHRVYLVAHRNSRVHVVVPLSVVNVVLLGRRRRILQLGVLVLPKEAILFLSRCIELVLMGKITVVRRLGWCLGPFLKLKNSYSLLEEKTKARKTYIFRRRVNPVRAHGGNGRIAVLVEAILSARSGKLARGAVADGGLTWRVARRRLLRWVGKLRSIGCHLRNRNLIRQISIVEAVRSRDIVHRKVWDIAHVGQIVDVASVREVPRSGNFAAQVLRPISESGQWGVENCAKVAIVVWERGFK